jgi:ADP-heptose:LPS heptosyltransferase
MPKPKHILVIRLSALGDVAMTIPVLGAFTTQYPDVKLTVLTKPFFKPFFRNIPNLTVVPADVKGKYNGVVGLYRLSKELKELHIDAIADLHNVLRSNILKFFLFGKRVVQIDKGRREKKALINGQSFQQLKRSHQRYADVFETLGYPIDLSQPIFPKKENLKENCTQVTGQDSKPWIGLAPFAAFDGKKYPLDLLEKLIEKLTKEYKVLLFGGPGHETSMLDILATEYNAVSVAGKFSMEDELDIMSNLDVMISMDSGNAHMAAMLGVKVVTVWGITHPYAGFLPFNHTIDSAILADRSKYPKIPTSIYGNSFPKGYGSVMRSITPEEIVSKIKTTLK